jgi:uncharacterized protein (DUF58 family)
MHLSDRAFALIFLAGMLAIAGTWSDDPVFKGLWLFPTALLFLGLAIEGVLIRRTSIESRIETSPRALLGREQPAAFAFRNASSRDVKLQYVPVMPAGFEALPRTRFVTAPRGGVGRDSVSLVPVRLGAQLWPTIPARLLGRFALAWWPRDLHPAGEIRIAPDALRTPRRRPTGVPTGMRPRRTVGAGSELHQLRAYVPGDPLARIDWKASARTRRLVTREFSEDQHLDVLIAIDAGRLSRVRAGRIDRLGLYANIAARFAEIVTPNDDRIGLVVYSDRTLALTAPERGLPAVTRIRNTLERLSVKAAESDPIAAAVRIRGLLKHRGLVVMLTDLDDAMVAEQLARAVRLLSPPHLVVIAGVRSTEIADLSKQEARGWRDPWIALAAQEHETRAAAQRVLLRRLGAPVVATREELLEQAVFAEYEALRRSRRV